MKPKQGALKMLHCWNTLPDRAPAHHLCGRLDKLVKGGWAPRLAHFNRLTAFVWLEPTAQGASKPVSE
jgi:hypothetical protein